MLKTQYTAPLAVKNIGHRGSPGGVNTEQGVKEVLGGLGERVRPRVEAVSKEYSKRGIHRIGDAEGCPARQHRVPAKNENHDRVTG